MTFSFFYFFTFKCLIIEIANLKCDWIQYNLLLSFIAILYTFSELTDKHLYKCCTTHWILAHVNRGSHYCKLVGNYNIRLYLLVVKFLQQHLCGLNYSTCRFQLQSVPFSPHTLNWKLFCGFHNFGKGLHRHHNHAFRFFPAMQSFV